MKKIFKYLAVFGLLAIIAKPVYSASNKFIYQIIASGGITSPSAGQDNSEQYGNGASAAIRATALGKGANAGGDSSISIGWINGTAGAHDICIGTGLDASSSLGDNIFMGRGAVGQGSGNVGLCQQCNLQGTNNVVLDSGNDGTGGTSTTTTGSVGIGAAVTIGAGCDNDIAIGNGVTIPTNLDDAIGIGHGATLNSGTTFSVAIGRNSHVTASNGVALGNTATAAQASVAVGPVATCTGGNSIAIGNGPTASGNEGIAIGDTAHSTSGNGVALGYHVNAAANEVAIGSHSDATTGGYLIFGVYNGSGGVDPFKASVAGSDYAANGDTGIFIPIKLGGVIVQRQLKCDTGTGICSITP